MCVHAKILEVSHALDETLKRIAVPHYGPSATPDEVNRARQFSASIVMAAFDGNIPHDYGATHVEPEELATLLPRFEGALKLARALNTTGVMLPVRRTVVERIWATIRSIASRLMALRS